MGIKMSEPDTNYTFSCRPGDKEGLAAITKLKEQSRNTGISFSFLVIKAIKQYTNRSKKNATK